MATASSATPKLSSSTFVTRPNSVLGNNTQSIGQAKKQQKPQRLPTGARALLKRSPCGPPSLPSAAVTSALSPASESRK